jgi:hypothetical protein
MLTSSLLISYPVRGEIKQKNQKYINKEPKKPRTQELKNMDKKRGKWLLNGDKI